MPAPTTPLSGYTMVLQSPAGTAVSAKEDTTLNLEQDNINTYSSASSRWDTNLNGPTGWSVDFSNLYYKSAVEAGCGASIAWETNTMKGLTTMTINLEQDMIESTSQTVSCVRAYVQGARRVSVDFEAVYYDPNGTGAEALEALLDEIEAGTAAGLTNTTISFGTNQTITGTTRPSNVSVAFPNDDVVRVSGTLNFTGTVTGTFTSLDTGQANILNNLFSDTTTVTVQIITTSATTSQSSWSGQAWAESLSITVAYDDAVRVSGTMRGTGALTRTYD